MVKDEELKQEKARRREYKYKEAYTGIYYTTIPQRKVIQGLSGSALTEANFDKSLILLELLSKEYGDKYQMLLGELQYAFVSFLLGENLESFEQWKRLMLLLCQCD